MNHILRDLLYVSKHELELLASGVQNIVTEHLIFSLSLKEHMYDACVLAILHLPVTTYLFMHISTRL
jgi:hypothetical protein